MATVDIIVPCYNYGRYLRHCVASALLQPGVDVRVLIIDDHSSDNTPDIARELSETDSRVTFRRHDVNRGHIATYNEGLGEATADYVVLLSADDMLTPGALHRATALMEAHPAVGLVYGHPIPLYSDSLPRPRNMASGWTVWEGREWIRLMCRAGRNFIHCPEVVMRTRIQHAIGGYRAALPHSGDMEMWLRAAIVCDVGRVNGADQAYYRIHSLSMQRTTFAGALNDLQGRRDAFESALRVPGDRLPDAQQLLETAYRSLALDAIECARRACAAGRATVEPVREYCEFAQSVFPKVVHAREWRALEYIQHRRPSTLATMSRRRAALLDRFRRYWAWRRWCRTGVY